MSIAKLMRREKHRISAKRWYFSTKLFDFQSRMTIFKFTSTIAEVHDSQLDSILSQIIFLQQILPSTWVLLDVNNRYSGRYGFMITWSPKMHLHIHKNTPVDLVLCLISPVRREISRWGVNYETFLPWFFSIFVSLPFLSVNILFW
jgi:hypothetical protein